ncbi:MAG: ThiF family adenylyltransferase [Saprospiraceae bacterium]|nr:ThiF family adenylyltransferase [Saprospiraceae bacterium]
MTDYIFPPAIRKSLEINSLNFTKSKEVLRAVTAHDFCKLIEVGIYDKNDVEYLIVEISVQRPQFPVNPINYVERILIEIENSDKIPCVYALRVDFPKLPHQNLMPFEKPRCLCLYEQSKEEVWVTWTAFSFLERIRDWFSLSAKGKLHQENQPLEPFFINSIGNIIIPHNFNVGDIFFISSISENNFIVTSQKPSGNNIPFRLEVFKSIPVVHGFINKEPQNLQDLIYLLNEHRIDLTTKLNEYFKDSSKYNLFLLILLYIPRKRFSEGVVESIEKYAFLCLDTIEEIGIKLGVLAKENNNVGLLIGSQIDINSANVIPIGILRPYTEFDKNLARLVSKVSDESKIVQIGIGAVGSELFNLASRSGFGGHWTLVDNDILLPHNLYRHSLLNFQVGKFKSHASSDTANYLLKDSSFSTFIIEKIGLNPLSEDLDRQLQDAKLIIDTSASLAVSRKLSRMEEYEGRRISFFLNPKGDALVCIAEEVNREITLNELEAFYYQLLNNEPLLNSHFTNEHKGIRYGNSCRDVSNYIPNERFGIFSSIATGVLKELEKEEMGFIRIWQLSGKFGINHFQANPTILKKCRVKEWDINISNELLDKMFKKRIEKLPVETGGILVGLIDTQYKSIYIVDSIFSPNDSREYPTAYYRGIDGLGEQLKSIEYCTNNFLTYLGEWHSHPKGCSVNQSSDDLILFAWLSNFMQSRGIPGVMLILNDKEIGIYITEN